MQQNTAKEQRIEKLLKDFTQANLQPLWTLESDIMPHAPKPKAIPYLWKWAAFYDLAKEAGELITRERQKPKYPPMSTFKWSKTEQALLDLVKSGDSSHYDDIALEYINPLMNVLLIFE